jgi:hypothetical protein
MTPELMAELVARWARLYTLGLPTPTRQRRVSEIAADLHDQIAHERAHGTGDRRIALSILSRMVRGLPADASWRSRQAPDPAARRSLIGIMLAAAFLLSVPLVAMQVTDEVAWGPGDFVVAGALIVGTGLLLRAAVRKAGDLAYRAAVGVALAAAFVLVWTNLAVGLIGEPGDLANAMYVGVLAVGILGAITVRFRPEGMARALLATALVQALVAGIALIAGEHEAPGSSVFEILAPNAFFAAVFIGSALLFRHAAHRSPLRSR